MRILTMVIGIMMIASCYALEIVRLHENLAVVEDAITKESLQLQASLDARLPVKSKACVGAVPRHAVNYAALPNPIFIIGDDPVSKQWLSNHRDELRQLHAVGFITNIKNPHVLDELQTVSGLALLPANVDDLMACLETTHYPLIANKGMVWQ